MKTRHGFVSNSSSSSFCIYGTALEKDEALQKISQVTGISTADLQDGVYNSGGEFLEEVLAEANPEFLALSVIPEFEWSESIFIGRYWSAIGLEETGQQFIESVQKGVALLGPECRCSTIDQVIPG